MLWHVCIGHWVPISPGPPSLGFRVAGPALFHIDILFAKALKAFPLEYTGPPGATEAHCTWYQEHWFPLLWRSLSIFSGIEVQGAETCTCLSVPDLQPDPRLTIRAKRVPNYLDIAITLHTIIIYRMSLKHARHWTWTKVRSLLMTFWEIIALGASLD